MTRPRAFGGARAAIQASVIANRNPIAIPNTKRKTSQAAKPGRSLSRIRLAATAAMAPTATVHGRHDFVSTGKTGAARTIPSGVMAALTPIQPAARPRASRRSESSG
jgi:hypothetical protein